MCVVCRKQYLNDSEKVLRTGLVFKKRRAFNVKKRQLILTDAPRVVYVDPGTKKEKGQISLSEISKAAVKDSSHFIIFTVSLFSSCFFFLFFVFVMFRSFFLVAL